MFARAGDGGRHHLVTFFKDMAKKESTSEANKALYLRSIRTHSGRLSKPDQGFILIQNPSGLQMGVESAKADD